MAKKEKEKFDSMISAADENNRELIRETRDRNKLMLSTTMKIAERSKAKLIFIYADAIEDFELPSSISRKTSVVLVTRDETSLNRKSRKLAKHVMKIPSINLTRAG